MSSDSDDPLALMPHDAVRPAKRRRVTIEEPEQEELIVSSSDADEREAIASNRPEYWVHLKRREESREGTTHPQRRVLLEPPDKRPNFKRVSIWQDSGSLDLGAGLSHTHVQGGAAGLSPKNISSQSLPGSLLLPLTRNEPAKTSVLKTDREGISPHASPNATPKVKKALFTSQGFTRNQSSPSESILVPSTPDDINETYVSPRVPYWASDRPEDNRSPLGVRQSFPPYSQMSHSGLPSSNSPSPPLILTPNRPRDPPPSQRGYISSAFRRASFSSTLSTPSKSHLRPRARSDSPTPIVVSGEDSPPRRSLRQRTAIQIAPYTREALMYKATLVRAGAKEALVKNPARVAGVAAPGEETVDGEADSQEREWDGEASQFQPPDDDVDESFRYQEPPRMRAYIFDRKRPQLDPSPERGAPKTKERRKKSPAAKTALPHRRAEAQRTHKGDSMGIDRYVSTLGGSISDDEEGLQLVDFNPKPHQTRPLHTKLSPQAAKRAADSLTTFVMALGGEITDDEDDLAPGRLTSHNPRKFASLPIRARHRSPPRESSSSHASARSLSANSSSPPAADVLSSSVPPPLHLSRNSSPEVHVPRFEDFDMDLPAHSEGHLSPPPARMEPSITPESPRATPSRLSNKRAPAEEPIVISSSSPSETESEEELTEFQQRKEREKRKALVKVLPAFMIKKLQREAIEKERPARRTSVDSEDNDEQHQSSENDSDRAHSASRGGRVKHIPDMGGRLDIQGDEESSEDEIVHVRNGPDRVVDFRDDFIDDRIASSEESGEDRHLDRADLATWLDQPSPPIRRRRSHSPAPKDGDLIDRMLSRHVNITTNRKRKTSQTTKRRSVGGKARRSGGQSTLHDFVSLGHQGRRQPQGVPSLTKINISLQRSPEAARHPKKRRSTFTRDEAVSVRWTDHSMLRELNEDALLGSDNDHGGRQRAQSLSAVLQPVDATTRIGIQRQSIRRQETAAVSTHQLPSRPQKLGKQKTQAGSVVADMTSYQDALSGKRSRDLLIDLGLPKPVPGAAFVESTYLGSGRLVELLSTLASDARPSIPRSVAELSAALTPMELEDRIPLLFESFFEWVSRDGSPVIDPVVPASMHFLSEYVSYGQHILSNVGHHSDFDRLVVVLSENVQHLVRRTCNAGEDGPYTTDESLERTSVILWFAVELSARISQTQGRMHGELGVSNSQTFIDIGRASMTGRYLLSLMAHLIRQEVSGLGGRQLQDKSTELWICAFHLTDQLCSAGVSETNAHPFWDYISDTLRAQPPASALQTSELFWRTIFTALLISRFTTAGVAFTEPKLQACWPLVLEALSTVRLDADEGKESSDLTPVLKQRDSYIRLLLARCLSLVTRWTWTLSGVDVLFKPLTSIFRSRKFSNLRGETSDFPVFLLDRKEDAYLDDYDSKETSFGLYLKLVLQAARYYRQDERGVVHAQKQVRKLASLIFPIGATQFTKSNPPIGRELSMLFNRFAAAVVVIHLEPENAKLRLQQARRYLDFRNADYNARSACIRGMMLLAMAHCRQHLDLTEIMAWHSDMVDCLTDDLKALELPGNQDLRPAVKMELSIGILQLVGVLRKVVETAQMSENVAYPDPALLERARLDKIMQSSLPTDVRTSSEIRKFIQVFLGARNAALRVRFGDQDPADVQLEDTQGSDSYGDFAIDWTDARVVAAIGGNEKTPDMIMEERVTDVLKTTLLPAIFRLVQRNFGDANPQVPDDTLRQDDNLDQWVECWVGCIDVLVRNNVKAWADYQEWGDDSLDRIANPRRRRVIEFKFMLALLRVNPSAYSPNKDWFVRVLIVSLVPVRFFQESEYVSKVLNADRMKHPLMQSLPCVGGDGVPYDVTVEDIKDLRLAIFRTIARNLAALIRRKVQTDRDKQIIAAGLAGIVGALAAMRENWEDAVTSSSCDQGYLTFCLDVRQHLRSSTELWNESRIAQAASWIDGVAQP